MGWVSVDPLCDDGHRIDIEPVATSTVSGTKRSRKGITRHGAARGLGSRDGEPAVFVPGKEARWSRPIGNPQCKGIEFRLEIRRS